MNNYLNILNLTIVATAPIAHQDLVGFNDAPITADDAPVKAVALNPAAIGDATSGLAIGTIKVKASGVVTAGDKLVSAAAGGAKTAGADPVNVFATALTSAADGKQVEILVR